ncbi:SAM-dependent methyltransferase [Gorillibacterium sp. CAU 1737]|uniref:SAM-dependent methyltransferase n=1 Tax=Gorillibacterium sp. CAU 1737 TaxID=3140362 RepID=UPI0032616A2E
MKQYSVTPIGTVRADANGSRVELAPAYLPALTGLEGFSHILVFWWFDQCDHPAARSKLLESSPYHSSPELLGTFATRSPERPNPIALSCAAVRRLDGKRGIIEMDYLDAEDGSPVLDIKPYTPSLDRVEHPAVPAWCSEWPSSIEASGEFDWSKVFTF